MRTLYLRNVPDEVVDRLERLARREGQSVNAFAVRELTVLASRADNAALLATLPGLDLTSDDNLNALRGERERR